MIERKQGHIKEVILTPLIRAMEIIHSTTYVEICRDPDDNKFLGCAKDSQASKKAFPIYTICDCQRKIKY